MLELGTTHERRVLPGAGMNADDQTSSNQPKSRSGPEFLGLSRCAACYNHKANSKHWRGGDGESSSSAEDSGPEVDVESEAESSSSSSCSGEASSESLEKPEPEKLPAVSDDAAEPESGGEDGEGGQEEAGETSETQEDKSRTMTGTRRAPLVKSFSLPSSFTPALTPLPRLPRPHKVVSVLRLQVVSQNHNDDALCIVRQPLSEREEEATEGRTGGGRGGVNLLPPQMALPWQQRSQPTLQHHQLLYQYQQPLPQHFPPLLAEGQRLPPPLPHALPVLHPPNLHPPLQAPNGAQGHLHALTQPCWYCYSMQFPYSPY